MFLAHLGIAGIGYLAAMVIALYEVTDQPLSREFPQAEFEKLDKIGAKGKLSFHEILEALNYRAQIMPGEREFKKVLGISGDDQTWYTSAGLERPRLTAMAREIHRGQVAHPDYFQAAQEAGVALRAAWVALEATDFDEPRAAATIPKFGAALRLIEGHRADLVRPAEDLGRAALDLAEAPFTMDRFGEALETAQRQRARIQSCDFRACVWQIAESRQGSSHQLPSQPNQAQPSELAASCLQACGHDDRSESTLPHTPTVVREDVGEKH